MAIICPCKGFHTRLNGLSPKERNAAHTTSLGEKTNKQTNKKERKKTQCEGRDVCSSRYLPFRSSERRQRCGLPVLNQPSEWIGRTSPPRSAGSPTQPQLEETNTNVADVSPLQAGKKKQTKTNKKKNPLHKKRDDEKRGRSKQLSQEAITLLSETRKVGSKCFSFFFFLLSSASSTANLRCCPGDPARTRR